MQAQPNFTPEWRIQPLTNNLHTKYSRDIKDYLLNFLKNNNYAKANYKNLIKDFFYKFSELRSVLRNIFGFGFYYIRGLVFILFIDACLTDDEPL